MDEKRIRVLLDVSPACVPESARAGLARVAMHLACALERHPDVDLRVVAWGWVQAAFDLETAIERFPVKMRTAGAKPGTIERAFSRSWVKHRACGRVPAWLVRAGQVLNALRDPVRGLDPDSFDIVHSTFSRVPRSVRRWGTPIVFTLHDVTPLKLGSAAPRSQVATMRRTLRSIAPSDWIVPISLHTRRDFEEVAAGHRSDRVHVIPNAVDRDAFRPASVAERADAVLRAHGLPEGPFFLSLSSLAPHKNIRFLLAVWSEVRRNHPAATLVVAGGRTTDRAALQSEFGADAGVHFTGYVPDEALAVMLSRCEAFLFPSLYEGFGLPVLEAMACGAPVIASNRTAIPEVAGDAATLLDPEDTDAWVRAIGDVLACAPRTGVHEPSIRRAAQFEWSGVAASYVALYCRALQQV